MKRMLSLLRHTVKVKNGNSCSAPVPDFYRHIPLQCAVYYVFAYRFSYLFPQFFSVD